MSCRTRLSSWETSRDYIARREEPASESPAAEGGSLPGRAELLSPQIDQVRLAGQRASLVFHQDEIKQCVVGEDEAYNGDGLAACSSTATHLQETQ